MKYGIYHNEKVPSIDQFTDGAYLTVICKVKEYVNRIVNLENVGWEVRDCIKFFIGGDSLQIGLLRKPFKGTVANNVLTNGCGGMNIDACRISHDDPEIIRKTFDNPAGMFTHPNRKGERGAGPSPEGRFPANMILDKAAGAILDVQAPKSGNMYSGQRKKAQKVGGTGHTLTRAHEVGESAGIYDGLGGASRFFKQCNSIDELKAYLKILIDPEA